MNFSSPSPDCHAGLARRETCPPRGWRAACRALALPLAAALLAGCAAGAHVTYPGGDERFTATPPPEPRPAFDNGGAIFQTASSQSLFQDYKARRVGDVLTVLLAERTNARKSAGAATSKESSVRMNNPVIIGRPITRDGNPLFEAEVSGSRSFEGQGDASQSNLLEGSITVTVAEVLPNGNLRVQGEKWMRINQGEEFIRLRGIVRPVDIRADNSVLSTQVADAQLAYGGTGTIAHSSSPGWLTRFFNSPAWPF
ncbi:MAG: flagellar basal body L-ring protein FlgH [Gammaproteobacteria bacterium]|nr:flagellar basal body L-ring protein FlgH [Gammaproteobacteria bacterium]